MCFFKGLDAYIRTWLQFVFPIYIWILVGLMIFLSRYSIVIARLSGSNTVSVLATLFLLSYAKLLRTIIAAISFTTLTDSNEKTSAVWLLDGNIPAMNTAHIPLGFDEHSRISNIWFLSLYWCCYLRASKQDLDIVC